MSNSHSHHRRIARADYKKKLPIIDECIALINPEDHETNRNGSHYFGAYVSRKLAGINKDIKTATKQLEVYRGLFTPQQYHADIRVRSLVEEERAKMNSNVEAYASQVRKEQLNGLGSIHGKANTKTQEAAF